MLAMYILPEQVDLENCGNTSMADSTGVIHILVTTTTAASMLPVITAALSCSNLGIVKSLICLAEDDGSDGLTVAHS